MPLAANHFALGYIVRPSGQRIPILSSGAESAGDFTLTLAWAPAPPLAIDETWVVVPGYDGTLATADTKFTNVENFRGFPFAPTTNPSVIPLKKDADSQGKK
jgi:hypothetical protein